MVYFDIGDPTPNRVIVVMNGLLCLIYFNFKTFLCANGQTGGKRYKISLQSCKSCKVTYNCKHFDTGGNELIIMSHKFVKLLLCCDLSLLRTTAYLTMT